MYKDLNGKVALVTGGGRDIGKAIAYKLAENGVAVAINYRSSKEEAESAATTIREQGGRAVAIQADVTCATDVARLVEETIRTLGDPIHILVNNAGGLLARKKIADMEENLWDTVMAVNLKSVFLVTELLLFTWQIMEPSSIWRLWPAVMVAVVDLSRMPLLKEGYLP